MRATFTTLVVLALGTPAHGRLLAPMQEQAPRAPATLSDSNLAIIDHWFARNNARDRPALVAMYSARARFHDPTYGIDLTGRDSIVGLYASNFALVDEHVWSVDHRFASGAFVVVAGRYQSAFDGAKVGRPGVRASAVVPFYTVFQLADGLIVEQWDYFAYDEWDRANPTIPIPVARRRETAATLQRVESAWLAAGQALPARIDEFVALYAPTMSFADPTFGLALDGRARWRTEVLRFAEIGRQNDARSEIIQRFQSGAFIAVWGVYSQRRRPGGNERVSMRFLTVLELENGLIARHRDYYEADALRAPRAP